MDARLKPEEVDAAVRLIRADAETRQVPVLWWVGPSTQPSNLGARLEKSGFMVDEDSPGMAVKLGELNESLPVPDGLQVQHVSSDDEMQEWCLTMARGFEAPASKVDFMVESWYEFMRIVESSSLRAYLARLDGRPVATSLLKLGGGAAGIYAVSTIPEARRKGIGARVTLYPLLQARAMGYKVGVLEASEMGLPMYRSLGFQEYCRITTYIYRPEL